MMVDVLVVGAGIAGLATAYELHLRSVPFTMMESSARVGGIILSEQIDGYTIDAGPDALLVQKPEGIRLCEELGLGERLVATKPPRLAFVQRGGRLHALPPTSVLGIPTEVGPFLRTRLFSWPGKMRVAAELFVPPRSDDGDESIGAFITRRFGREATEYLAEPLLAGIHAGDVDRLSIRALFPRFADAERTSGSLLRAFRQPQQRHGRAGQEESDGAFRSLSGGLDEMIRALVAKLPANSIRLSTPVCRITRRDAFQIETEDGLLQARAVVLATPAFVTARLVRSLSGVLANLCDEIPYASTATVALAFRRTSVTHPLKGSGFVVPRTERTGILAASWLSSKWPNRAPDHSVLLRAFVGGARDPQGLARSDPELVTLALNALGPLLGITGPPILTRVYRWERASAQHEVGHLTRLEAIKRTLEGLPGLFLSGSGFRGVGIPDCVADGRATARQLSGWLAGAGPGSGG